jgi:hypothetical protein
MMADNGAFLPLPLLPLVNTLENNLDGSFRIFGEDEEEESGICDDDDEGDDDYQEDNHKDSSSGPSCDWSGRSSHNSRDDLFALRDADEEEFDDAKVLLDNHPFQDNAYIYLEELNACFERG